MRNFQKNTGISIGILLLENLPPQNSIEQYAAETLSQLNLGRENKNRGLLFVWSERERLFKIEVSYGLEHIFPDAVCQRLEAGARTFMISRVPYAQRDFLAELMATMGIHYLAYQQHGKTSELVMTTSAPGKLSGYLSGGAGSTGKRYASILDQAMQEISMLPRSMNAEMHPDAQVETVIQRYISSLGLGIGDPNLPMITEGSRYFRMEKPLTPGYLQRINHYISDAMPYRVLERGDKAAVMFSPGKPVLPILLRRDTSGKWFVDEAASWAEFQLADDGRMLPKHDQSPFAFATESEQTAGSIQSIFGNRANIPELPQYQSDLIPRIRNLENEIELHPVQTQSYLKLAEIMHFELYWMRSAAALYEKVLALDPGRLDLHWRLIDLYRNMEEIDEEARHYKAILKITPADSTAQYYFKWLKETFEMTD